MSVPLYEFESKALLAGYGAPNPDGGVWPHAMNGLAYPVMVKTQLLEGGRGKRGGIVAAASGAEVERLAATFLAGLDGLPPAGAVLVEERLPIEHEFYLALVMDRGWGGPMLLASPDGGVEVESVDGDRFLRLPLQPGAWERDFIASTVLEVYELGPEHRAALERVLHALWRTFWDRDCLLAEVNPLVLTDDGRLVVADARVVMDGAARWRAHEMPDDRSGTAFERACGSLGAIGVELDGSIAIVTSGAGLAMATLDLVASRGGPVRAVVDLGGTVHRPQDLVRKVVREVLALEPETLFVNYYLQLASAVDLAKEVAAAVDGASGTRLVVRAAGRDAEAARRILTAARAEMFTGLEEACDAAVRSRVAPVAGGAP